MRHKGILYIKQVLREFCVNENPGDSFLNQLASLVAAMPYDPVPYNGGDSVCITFSKPKTAALCYDKIWFPFPLIPRDMRYSDFGRAEIGIAPLLLNLLGSKGLLKIDSNDPLNEIGKFFDTELLQVLNERHQRGPASTWKQTRGDLVTPSLQIFFRDLVFQENAIHMTPVYETTHHWESDFSPKEAHSSSNSISTVMAVLTNLEIVSEDSLSWDQIREFRKDTKAHRDYRRLLHWFDKELINQPYRFVEDEVSVRLDNYRSALKRHGINTVLGTVSDALDGKYLLGASAVTALGKFFDHPVWGAVAAGTLTVSKVTVNLIQKWIKDNPDAHDRYRDVAYIYEVEKRFGDKTDNFSDTRNSVTQRNEAPMKPRWKFWAK